MLVFISILYYEKNNHEVVELKLGIQEKPVCNSGTRVGTRFQMEATSGGRALGMRKVFKDVDYLSTEKICTVLFKFTIYVAMLTSDHLNTIYARDAYRRFIRVFNYYIYHVYYSETCPMRVFPAHLTVIILESLYCDGQRNDIKKNERRPIFWFINRNTRNKKKVKNRV